MLGREVAIDAPQITVINWADMLKSYYKPCVVVTANYTEGLQGTNALLLKSRDAKMLSSLITGSDTEADPSSLSEVMSRILDSVSASLTPLIKEKTKTDTPFVFTADLDTHEMPRNSIFDGEDAVCLQFKMQIGDLTDARIMQLLPVKFAKKLSEKIVPAISELTAQPKAESAPTLEITIELGRTSKTTKEISGFSPGAVIELNKAAGEPIDILADGKFVGKGEIVAVNSGFGIRVTGITKTNTSC